MYYSIDTISGGALPGEGAGAAPSTVTTSEVPKPRGAAQQGCLCLTDMPVHGSDVCAQQKCVYGREVPAGHGGPRMLIG